MFNGQLIIDNKANCILYWIYNIIWDGSLSTTQSLLPAECNPPAQQKVSKGKPSVSSVDIADIKAPHCPGIGVLTRSLVQKNSNPFQAVVGFLLPSPTHDYSLLECERA